ncbi:hypothetical protein COO72_00075 [Bifidobacterium callitrichos]|nr:hypothetical protein COO72_00075 [Bifidobacterium callitrichos]
MGNEELKERIGDLPQELESLETAPEIRDMLARIDAETRLLNSLHPLDGVEESALDNYRRDWLARYTYNSNAIEGSTLTLEDTELVLEGEFIPTDSPARFIFAARGVADGMDYVRRYVTEHRALDIDLIQKIHEVTALDVQPALRGRFRPYGYNLRIAGTRVKTAEPLDIYEDMEALLAAVSESRSHPVLTAAGFHAMFENIHPFADGNGRTGRQILNFMLMSAGYQPVALKHDAGRTYGESLERWQVDHDPKGFCEILGEGIVSETQDQATIITQLRDGANLSGRG